MLFEREVFEERIRSPRLQRFAVVTSWSWYITIYVFFKQLRNVKTILACVTSELKLCVRPTFQDISNHSSS